MIVPPAIRLMKDAFENYAHDATVRNEKAQTYADACARWFWDRLTLVERVALTRARIDVFNDPKNGNRRKEFDAICKQIRTRLFKNQNSKGQMK